jgi:signal transduction histidine kinase
MERATVLVVDDNPQNVELVMAYLQADGHNAVAAMSGKEALERVEDHPPDLVLLDVMMPGMNGYEVCTRLKGEERTRFIPVVMITALKDLEDKIKGIEVGADDFLTKPFNKQELLTRVRSLLKLKRLHDQLESSYRNLQELQNTKENLTQMIVHDLKNPLTGIMANLEIVAMEELRESRECLEAAQRSCMLLFNMIMDLLDLSRSEEGKLQLNREPFALKEIVYPNVQLADTLARLDGKSIQVALPSSLPTVVGDRNLITRVMANLLNNAIKHTSRGGTIRIGAEEAPGEFLRVFIQDTGRSIPAEYREKIFEKFGQIEGGRRTGVGLGLTFCKMAVEAHEGRIWLESPGESGNRFCFTVPVET